MWCSRRASGRGSAEERGEIPGLVSRRCEVRRRTRSIGCFINDASVERIIFGLFRFMNQRRAGKVCIEELMPFFLKANLHKKRS